jgi:dihydrofolate synthase/folylpolyglutamate synthase
VANHQPDTTRPLNRLRALQWLEKRANFERQTARSGSFGLNRMRSLLRELDHPERRFPAAHLAGTKGKGSTAAMLASIVRSAGYRVGCYLSPHVDRIEERITVGGRAISTADLLAAFRQVIPAVEMIDRRAERRGAAGPTWFEVMTAIAFTHFAKAQVDLAVIETGLGGRLDATNLCVPIVSMITSVSYDHMDMLGNTITAIATEKAGIIRRDCPVISAATHPEAITAVSQQAARRRSRLLLLDRDFTVTSASVVTNTGPEPVATNRFVMEFPLGTRIGSYVTAMTGHHQTLNAAVAVMATRVLNERGLKIPDRAIQRGLQRTRLPARIEWLSMQPPIILDAAHNVASMQSLVQTLKQSTKLPRRRILVFAASRDKQLVEMLAESRSFFTAIVLTRYATNPRAATLATLRLAAEQAGWPESHLASTPGEAVSIARRLAAGRGLICVAGSFFLAAEARTALTATQAG